jgi:hypothetical protein
MASEKQQAAAVPHGYALTCGQTRDGKVALCRFRDSASSPREPA